MKKRTFLLTAAIILSCGLSMNAMPAFRQPDLTPNFQATALAWNFIYAFGNGPVPGLSWLSSVCYG